jgi:glutamyl-tRNA synthetase
MTNEPTTSGAPVGPTASSGHSSLDLGHSGHYRGRLAPSPTGYLHLGHARTFWTAQERARAAGGTLILRNDDLDRDRVRPEFVRGFLEDLRWFGCEWSEGPDIGGPFAPYSQSERLPLYRDAFERLRAGGFVYPCTCSRKDILSALTAPHAADDEPIYPGTCRSRAVPATDRGAPNGDGGRPPSWRFRVPDGEAVEFVDGHFGRQRLVAGTDFGDFLVWRHDGLPSYQLACVVDDAAMGITEVVRGADLLVSTARQLLLFRALDLRAPAFYHCPLVTDEQGVRLAKRHAALSLRALREAGKSPEEVRGGGQAS